MADKNKNNLNIIIRWAGVNILVLILSTTAYCSADSYLSLGSGCEREIRKIAEKCYGQSLDDESDQKCTDSVERMIEHCKDSE